MLTIAGIDGAHSGAEPTAIATTTPCSGQSVGVQTKPVRFSISRKHVGREALGGGVGRAARVTIGRAQIERIGEADGAAPLRAASASRAWRGSPSSRRQARARRQGYGGQPGAR